MPSASNDTNLSQVWALGSERLGAVRLSRLRSIAANLPIRWLASWSAYRAENLFKG